MVQMQPKAQWMKGSAHPLGRVEMETLEDEFPNLCTAQAKGCKYTHVGCPEVLHPERTQAFHDHLELCKAACESS